MSIEEITLDSMDLSDQADMKLNAPNSQHYDDNDNDEECIQDDSSVYENRYAHYTKEEIQEKINRRLDKLRKLLKRNMLRKLSPLDLIREQSKKIDSFINDNSDSQFILDETEVLVFYMEQIVEVGSIVSDINMDLSELREAYNTK